MLITFYETLNHKSGFDQWPFACKIKQGNVLFPGVSLDKIKFYYFYTLAPYSIAVNHDPSNKK